MVGSQQANEEKKIKREAKSHVHAYLRCSMFNWKSINIYILNYKFAIVKCLEIWIKENPQLERWKFPYPFDLPHFRHALIISIFLIWFSSTILFLMQLIKKKIDGTCSLKTQCQVFSVRNEWASFSSWREMGCKMSNDSFTLHVLDTQCHVTWNHVLKI